MMAIVLNIEGQGNAFDNVSLYPPWLWVFYPTDMRVLVQPIIEPLFAKVRES
jgi:hypothetical protein